MSKSAIYTANTVPTEVADGGLVSLGTTIRRFGNCTTQDGNTISLCGRGYWSVVAIATVEASSAAPVTLRVQDDGVDVIGAEATTTVAGTADKVALVVGTIVRNKCECGSRLSFAIDSAEGVTVTNMAVTVIKL